MRVYGELTDEQADSLTTKGLEVAVKEKMKISQGRSMKKSTRKTVTEPQKKKIVSNIRKVRRNFEKKQDEAEFAAFLAEEAALNGPIERSL